MRWVLLFVGWPAWFRPALWLTATSGNPIAVSLAEPYGVKINFGSWMLAASVPVLTMIALLPLILYKLFPPGVTETPDAPKAALRRRCTAWGH